MRRSPERLFSLDFDSTPLTNFEILLFCLGTFLRGISEPAKAGFFHFRPARNCLISKPLRTL